MISRKYTISSSFRIELIKKAGKKVYSPCLRVSFLPNDLEHQRFAAIVSTKVSKVAVYRNYIKRAIMEGARRTLLQDRFGADIVFFALNSNAKKNYEEIIQECQMILKKVQILFNKTKLQSNPIIETKPKFFKKTYSPLSLAIKKKKRINLNQV
ncbi:MAG: ribonuclease P protein component [Patescibacteria group bacterium]|nr:ribonuclease P protein component [Patescibacteria group bacterium]